MQRIESPVSDDHVVAEALVLAAVFLRVLPRKWHEIIDPAEFEGLLKRRSGQFEFLMAPAHDDVREMLEETTAAGLRKMQQRARRNLKADRVRRLGAVQRPARPDIRLVADNSLPRVR